MALRLLRIQNISESLAVLTRGFSKKTVPTLKMQSLGTKRPLRVSIEGNIGAGKSTLINYFNTLPGIETHGEPLDWWRDVGGHNLLDLMYSNINQWLKVFQTYVQLTRVKVQTSKPRNTGTTVQIFERSVQNNRYVFLEVANKGGFLTQPDYAVLAEWFQWIENNLDIDLDLIVYLRSTPEVVYDRIKARARPEEKSISLEYLKQLHESHEEWLVKGSWNAIPVLVLDANQTIERVQEEIRSNQHRILGSLGR